MNRRNFYIVFSVLCLPLLTGCVTSTDAKIAALRAEKLPALNSELNAHYLEAGAPVFIRVFKEEAELEVWAHDDDTGRYAPFKTYDICNYNTALGPKTKQGDLRSPEGFYDITQDRLWPGSRYHLAMNIGYPNEFDLAHKRTGDKLMIHGDCFSEGCFAMTDRVIEDLYLLADQSLRQGQASIPVHIFPFRMTAENLERHTASEYFDFWLNLKEGYDFFETTRTPPIIDVQQGRYIFSSPVFL